MGAKLILRNMNQKKLILISIIAGFIILVGVGLINAFNLGLIPQNSNEEAVEELNSEVSNFIDSTQEIPDSFEQIPEEIQDNLNSEDSTFGSPINLQPINNFQQFEIQDLGGNKGLLEVDKSYFQNDAFFQFTQDRALFERDLGFLSDEKAYFIIDYSTQTMVLLGYDFSIIEQLGPENNMDWFFGYYGTLGAAYFFVIDSEVEIMAELLLPVNEVVSRFSFESPEELEVVYTAANDGFENTVFYKISDLERITFDEFAGIEVEGVNGIPIETDFLPIDTGSDLDEVEIEFDDAQR